MILSAALHAVDVTATGLEVRLEPASVADCAERGVLRADRSELAVAIPGSVELERNPATLTVSVAGCWSPTTRVETGASQATLRLWPTGTVGGAVKSTPRSPPFEGLTARWVRSAAADPASPAETAPAGSAVCALAGTDWRCSIPAGRWDLRVGAPGLAPLFHWDVQVSASRDDDLGTFEAQPGSALSGDVEVEVGEPAGVRLILAPEVAIRSEGQRRRTELQAFETTSSETGAFIFAGVPPGVYVLKAEGSEELSAKELPGIEISNQGIRQLEEPIVLVRQRRIEVEISPGADPKLEPWVVRLSAQAGSGANFRSLFEVQAVGGYAIFAGLDEGRYRLAVLDAEGHEHAARAIEIGAGGDVFTAIELDFVPIAGTVRAGADPIACTVTLSSAAAGASGGKIELTTEDDGSFAGVVPRPGSWRVHLRAGGQRLALPEAVEIERDPEGATQLDLVLPGGWVRGRVVDEDGDPVDRAIVTALRDGRLAAQARIEADGRFAILGLKEGEVQLVSEASEGRGSAPLTVEIRDGEASEIELVVEAWRSVRLRLIRNGRPVSGASVVIHHPRFGGPQILHSGPSGVIETSLPPGQENLEIFVRAGRTPRVMRRIRIDDVFDETTVELSGFGGQLVIPFRKDTMDQILTHDGASFRLGELVSPGFGSVPEEIDQATFSFRLRMESGDYQLCRQAEEPTCRSAYLAPSSLVELALPHFEQDSEGIDGSDD